MELTNLKAMSKGDLIRILRGASAKMTEMEQLIRDQQWIVGALVAKLGGETIVSEEEMEEVLVGRVLARDTNEDGELLLRLVDRGTMPPMNEGTTPRDDEPTIFGGD